MSRPELGMISKAVGKSNGKAEWQAVWGHLKISTPKASIVNISDKNGKVDAAFLQ